MGGRGGGGAARNAASPTLLLASSAAPRRYSALLPRRAAAVAGTRGPGLCEGAGEAPRAAGGCLGAPDSAQPGFRKRERELARLSAPERRSDSKRGGAACLKLGGRPFLPGPRRRAIRDRRRPAGASGRGGGAARASRRGPGGAGLAEAGLGVRGEGGAVRIAARPGPRTLGQTLKGNRRRSSRGSRTVTSRRGG